MKFESCINSIVQGDCLDVMKDWPDNCVDLVLTDPPYFLPAKHYQTRTNFQRSFADLGIFDGFFRQWFGHIKRILCCDGHFYMFCDGQSYPIFYWHAYQFTKAARPLVWNKGTCVLGYTWRHQHELILFAQMPEAKPINTGDGDILLARVVPVENRKHPAEKPLGLVSRIVKKHNGLILDPFCGSGTTCVAAKMLGRRFIGIDISETYCEIARQRLEAVDTGVPVAEQRIGQMGLWGTES